MRISSLKPFFLTIAIIFGLFANAHRSDAGGLQTAVLAGGCFWCVESDFENVPGVRNVISGYTGGKTANPTYKEVSKGGTGHYEAVQITYDSGKVSYDELLRLFLRSVDPTDAGGQFCDRGDSYRTAIFVSNQAEKSSAQAAIAAAQAQLGLKIVTPILNASTFYPAEEVHQDYYKGKSIVLTRNGPKSKAAAYKFYRKACGRDERVQALWGDEAPFVGH